MVHTSYMLDKQGYMHARARARARAHTHTHTEICNIYCFSTATMIRERASVLRHTRIACLVCIIYATGRTTATNPATLNLKKKGPRKNTNQVWIRHIKLCPDRIHTAIVPNRSKLYNFWPLLPIPITLTSDIKSRISIRSLFSIFLLRGLDRHSCFDSR